MARKITQADPTKLQAALPILSQLSADMSQDPRATARASNNGDAAPKVSVAALVATESQAP